MKTRIVLLGLAIALCAGCVTAPAADVDGPPLPQLIAADLDAAIGIATANNDAIAARCFEALKKHLPSSSTAAPAPAGVVSAYAAARVRVRAFRAGIPEDVHVACAPLIVDGARTLTGLGHLLR